MAGKGSGKRMPASEQDPRGIAVRHDNMKKALKAKHLSRHALAQLMKVSDGTMDNWIDGSEHPGRGVPNDKLVEMADLLSVSVWYLLDQTNRTDGYGARPLGRHAYMARMAAIAGSPDEITTPTQAYIYEDIESEFLEAVFCSGPNDEDGTSKREEYERDQNKRLVGVHTGAKVLSAQDGIGAMYCDLDDLYERSASDENAPGHDAATKDWETFAEWYRQQKADSFRRDLFALKGDYRDPAEVIAAEARHAAETAGPARFDEIAKKLDSQLRGIMGTAATEQP